MLHVIKVWIPVRGHLFQLQVCDNVILYVYVFLLSRYEEKFKLNVNVSQLSTLSLEIQTYVVEVAFIPVLQTKFTDGIFFIVCKFRGELAFHLRILESCWKGEKLSSID